MNNKPKIDIPKATLEKLYIKEQNSLYKIAKIYHVCPNTVRKYLIKYNVPRRQLGQIRKNIGGKTFGHWFITNENKRINNSTQWKAICTKCNTDYWMCLANFTQHKTKQCHKCTDKERRERKEYKEIYSSLWCQIIQSAKSRNLVFHINVKFIWRLFNKQKGKCALSGVDIKFDYRKKNTASLDRIDNTKGYLKNNVQWVHKDINQLKHAFDEDYFIEMCTNVANHSQKAKITKSLDTE